MDTAKVDLELTFLGLLEYVKHGKWQRYCSFDLSTNNTGIDFALRLLSSLVKSNSAAGIQQSSYGPAC